MPITATKGEYSMSDNNVWVNGAAEIRVAKNGGFYLAVKKDMVLTKGRSFTMKTIGEHIDGLVDAKVLTPAEGKKELESKDYVKYVLSLAPERQKENSSNY